MEILLLSFLTVILQVEWNMTDAQTNSIVSAVFLGALVGTLTLGSMGDRIGRKPVFTVTAAIICLFGLLTAVCHTVRVVASLWKRSLFKSLAHLDLSPSSTLPCSSLDHRSTFWIFWYSMRIYCSVGSLLDSELVAWLCPLIPWRNLCRRRTAEPIY